MRTRYRLTVAALLAALSVTGAARLAFAELDIEALVSAEDARGTRIARQHTIGRKRSSYR